MERPPTGIPKTKKSINPYVNLRSIKELLAKRYLFWEQDSEHLRMFE